MTDDTAAEHNWTLDALAVAIANMSMPRLDALGIRTHVPYPPALTAINEALNGSGGRLRRWYVRRLFPHLFPRQYTALLDARKLAIEKWESDRLDYIMAQVADMEAELRA